MVVRFESIAIIPEVEQWLAVLDETASKHAAQIFITALMGSSHVRDSGPKIAGTYQSVEEIDVIVIDLTKENMSVLHKRTRIGHLLAHSKQLHQTNL